MRHPQYPSVGSTPRVIATASVTRLTADHRDHVVVAGSHGGLIAAYLAAAASIRAVILNDAGGGLDDAGIAGLAYLERIGMAAATVDAWSARIGDGADALACGVISHVNGLAARLGVAPGMPAAAAAQRLCGAPPAHSPPPPVDEAAYPLLTEPGCRPVWGLDTVSLAAPAHDGSIIITGSHGGLLDGQAGAALKCAARAAVFNDAGIGKDDAGLGRLAALETRAIAAATVDARTARIGDARSSWASGVISRCNDTAYRAGGRPGMTAQDFARLLIAF